METSKRKMSTTEQDDIIIEQLQNVKRAHVGNGSKPDKCCCNLIRQQQQEIEKLKWLLQSKEENVVNENQIVTTDLSMIEEKLNRLSELVEKKQETKPSTAPNFSLDSLHSKVDKLVSKVFIELNTRVK